MSSSYGGGGRGPPRTSNTTSTSSGADAEDAEQKAAERNLIRKCIDYHNPAMIDLSNRLYRKSSCRSSHVLHCMPYLQPHSSYLRHMDMPISQAACPNVSTAFLTHLAHVTRAKNSSPIFCLSWTPGGRRLLTGNQEGEFSLWDGVTFGFELIMSAHDASFRSMAWSHHRNYLLTCDAGGNIKYWSPSIAPVQSLDSHNGQAIHSLSFSPADTKFCSGGDDSTIRIWDWATHTEERVLEGHGWDVKCVQWHPRSSVIASGSKDNLVKLWDPRAGGTLCTLYGHKNTVTQVAWNDNGNWLLSASRDQLLKLYDIRTMRELTSFKGHNKEITAVAWHPIYESVLVSGGMDGTLLFWNVGPKGYEEPAARIPYAHDMAIWDLAWHPAGHMLATGSNDRQTKFWCRNRLGSTSGLPQYYLDESANASANTATGVGSAAAGGVGGVGGSKAGGGDKASKPDLLTEEMELGNHVGIVIGRRGATIISMQRATGCKMHVDQARRVLLIHGTRQQIETVKKRVGALLERVSNEERGGGGGGGSGGIGGGGGNMSYGSNNTHMQF